MTAPRDPLAGLDEEQRAAAMSVHGPVVILAGAGTGKTRTITHRIAHGVRCGAFDPARTMALTFTTRAAAELGRRLDDLGAVGVSARTFHSAALRQLRHFWAEEIGGRPLRIVSANEPLVTEAMHRCGVQSQIPLRDVVTQLDRRVAAWPTAEPPNGAPELPGVGADALASIAEQYEKVKTERGVIDFNDVLLILVGLLQTRRQVRDDVRRAYRWFTVDEFQDVTPLQMRLLELWLGDRNEICVVGDPAQAIYSFAGADAGLLVGFADRFPGASRHVLTSNYRCAPAVVSAANRVGEQIPGSVRLHASGREAAGPGRVQHLAFPDQGSEIRGVVSEIATLVGSGVAPGSLACLVRTNAQLEPLRAELSAAGVPCSVRVGDSFFERAEAREALTRLRGQARAGSDTPAEQAVLDVMTAMGLDVGGSSSERKETLASIRELARAQPSLAALVAELDRRRADGLAPPPAGVCLATIHAAKGLEWEVVFLLGLVEGLLPVAGTPDLAEERRLFYVAVTRAGDRLVMSRYQRREGVRVPASRFLTSLEELAEPSLAAEDGPAVAAPPRRVDRHRERRGPSACAGCGAGLVTGRERVVGYCRRCPVPVDESVRERLWRWRDETAAAAGMPPYAVLTDAAVEALAALGASDQQALVGLPGLGAGKLERYGEQIVQILAKRPGVTEPVNVSTGQVGDEAVRAEPVRAVPPQ